VCSSYLEEVVGVDLVKMQILTAMNKFVFSNTDVRIPRGHSIECRVYAENPYMGGVPSTGLLGKVSWPEGPRRRYEFGFDAGDTITAFYDPMIAKVIVWDENRLRAIEKMIHVLKDAIVFGVHTNIPYLIEILSHKEFVDGTMTTRFIENNFAEGLKPRHNEENRKKLSREIYKDLIIQKNGLYSAANSTKANSPWLMPWRNV
jgi:3-methylcrotonyl-CoA carboxylase alpha subunit